MALTDGLRDGETVVLKAKISKAAIIADWLCLPAVFLFFFLTVCLPVAIPKYLDAEVQKLVFDAVGIENPDFGDILMNLGIALQIPKFITVGVGVLLGLLVFCWLVWACVKTYLHFGYELVATDKRILVRARGDVLESSWQDVKNVFVSQSVGGRIFRYGNVTVHTVRGALTVKSVTRPNRFKEEFYCRMQNVLI